MESKGAKFIVVDRKPFQEKMIPLIKNLEDQGKLSKRSLSESPGFEINAIGWGNHLPPATLGNGVSLKMLPGIGYFESVHRKN